MPNVYEIWLEWRKLEITKKVAYIMALKDAPLGDYAITKKWVEAKYHEYLPSADAVIAEVMDFAASCHGATLSVEDARMLLKLRIKHAALKWNVDQDKALDLAKRYIENKEVVAGQVIEASASAKAKGPEMDWLHFLAELKIEITILAKDLSESGLELKAVARELA